MTVQSTNTIPKIIHHIWLGPLTPPIEAMKTWQDLHPDWQYILWQENNIPKLHNQKAFDASKSYPQKSDILRYELLYNYGGIFVDADEFCLKPIDPLFDIIKSEECNVFAAKEGNPALPDLIANGMIGCTKHNDFMLKMVENININQPGETWKIVGPHYLTNMIKKHKPQIHIFSPKTFFPIHHSSTNDITVNLKEFDNDSEVYGIQFWGNTNQSYKPVPYKNPFLYIRYLAIKIKKYVLRFKKW